MLNSFQHPGSLPLRTWAPMRTGPWNKFRVTT